MKDPTPTFVIYGRIKTLNNSMSFLQSVDFNKCTMECWTSAGRSYVNALDIAGFLRYTMFVKNQSNLIEILIQEKKLFHLDRTVQDTVKYTWMPPWNEVLFHSLFSSTVYTTSTMPPLQPLYKPTPRPTIMLYWFLNTVTSFLFVQKLGHQCNRTKNTWWNNLHLCLHTMS